ncbi:5-guanidino-2-oxopentanoate decarboxylase [Ectopseudomonas mendocina]|uniref:5-guanidino-2-oxopentanoate decarboxylase n=1 Tax=Ectopseudomonas mendocina TaxID=300 RepID=A0ABZ2RHF8_ECTME
MISCAQALVKLLEAYEVDSVFGIPGVHTLELYRALHGSSLRHVSPRHEQGAGFMADGYARVSGKPGVCFIITGPGMTNILTAMGQAYADSIPMLVISTSLRREHQHLGHGHLHEMPNQQALVAGVCAFSHSVQCPSQLPEVLARAFALFSCDRPRPVHIEIPLDVLAMSAANIDLKPRALPRPPQPAALDLIKAVALLDESEKPLILAGGGARHVGALLDDLAMRLCAPVALTTNARGLLPIGHPLLLDGVMSGAHGRELLDEADVVLAVGTELGETDYDFFGHGPLSFKGKLIRVDIDPQQALGLHPADVSLVGDAMSALQVLLNSVANHSRSGEWAMSSVRRVNTAERESWTPRQQTLQAVLNCLRDGLPQPVLVGDSTQPVYQGALGYRASQVNSWFNAGTGFGTLGYALPAAVGAKLGAPEQQVVAIIGDGGLQFSSAELLSAREAGVGLLIVLWNNQCYGEIRDYMQARQVPPLGVDILTPDFSALAAAYGIHYHCLNNLPQLRQLLPQLAATADVHLLELSAQDWLAA